MTKPDHKLDGLVLRVGDGRGFIVELKRDRYIITAAHCLPKLPPQMSIAYTSERTYPKLLAPLRKRPSVWAECRFVDPIADIAVLCSPDTQELSDEAEAYDRLIDSFTPLAVSDLDGETTSVELLPLVEGPRVRCIAWAVGRGPLWLAGGKGGIVSGMSGSPILAEDGSAIGVVATSSLGESEGGPNPRLASHLPGWLLAELGLRSRKVITARERRANRKFKPFKLG